MSKKTYWKGVEQLTNNPDFVKNAEKEFPEQLPIVDAYGDNTDEESTTRRDFLKVMGFSVAAVSLAACEAPVKKAIPYLNKPEEVDPGIPNYYASTFIDGSDYCPVVVKTREGRPILVEGNTFSSLTKGGVSARAAASVLSLYDNEKIKNPTKGGKEIAWDKLDAEVTAGLKAAGKVAIVANTVLSPSTKLVLKQFADTYNADLVQYDQVSVSALIEANRKQFGKAVVPAYKFGEAKTVVSFGADFLGNWVAMEEHTANFMATRKVGPNRKEMSQLFVFETMLSITGAQADYRTPVRASEEGLAVAALYNEIAKVTDNATVNTAAFKSENIKKAAKALLASKGKSIVVSGINNVAVQLMVNSINQMLDNYGKTVDLDRPSFQKQGNDVAMNAFVDGLKVGKYGAVVFYNANPVYDHSRGGEIAKAISKAKLSVATADRLNETASLCTYNAPDSHYLESWNDAEARKGFFALGQPTISTIFSTRQAQESFLIWAEDEREYEEVIQEYWKNTLFPMQSQESTFEKFWVRSLHNGVFETTAAYTSVHEANGDAVDYTSAIDTNEVVSSLRKSYKAGNAGTEIVVFSTAVMGAGTQANNPMLQETPDPITKVCWGNYIAMHPAQAKEMGLEEFETKKAVVKVSTPKGTVELPVVMQPGLPKGVLAIATGYGRDAEKAGKVAAQAAGFNAFTLVSNKDGFAQYAITDKVSVEATGEKQDLAQTQTHETIMGRESIIQETTLGEYKKNPAAARYQVMISTYEGKEKPENISAWDINNDGYGKKEEVEDKHNALWFDRMGLQADTHSYPNHHWGLAIDLNSCTGCSACVVACHLENNVPVVGKDEVVRRREMHWMRIDRYYAHEEVEIHMPEDYKKMEQAVENPEVVFQPMMCQHCNNAPCETVCPVAATTHSSEGLNQMTYNRCVGTKYCGNNCPYKVRRFNWFKYHNNNEFDYHLNNDLGKMVLNPDVTVRSRGVMEKCSMCVQRIQGGKLKAKREGRQMVDGDASTACATACPSNAIVFGDLNDPKSSIRKMMEGELEERAYNVLDEINTRPNVWYMAKVRNKDAHNA
ncbi:TAT-variant-translocated molybdopterin oxidoreductase [Limibacter armeniacum]|uniref:TAT-variant-translocated molybdopterin oxidoreductase n=1 Tax=Limibacter armeniacum TaxID=466084 RepID=UPI002FE53667